jgi:hypothetical protein
MLIFAAASAGSSGFSSGFERRGVFESDEPGNMVDEDDVNRVAISRLIGLNTIAARTNSETSLFHSSAGMASG